MKLQNSLLATKYDVWKPLLALHVVTRVTFSMVPFRNEYFNSYSSFSKIVHCPFDLNFVICDKVFKFPFQSYKHAFILCQLLGVKQGHPTVKCNIQKIIFTYCHTKCGLEVVQIKWILICSIIV